MVSPERVGGVALGTRWVRRCRSSARCRGTLRKTRCSRRTSLGRGGRLSARLGEYSIRNLSSVESLAGALTRPLSSASGCPGLPSCTVGVLLSRFRRLLLAGRRTISLPRRPGVPVPGPESTLSVFPRHASPGDLVIWLSGSCWSLVHRREGTPRHDVVV